MYSALTLAGFDPSGGAGLQRDLKVFFSEKIRGLSLATCLTDQNEKSFYGLYSIPDKELFKKQFLTLMKQELPQGIKIGLIPDQQMMEQVMECLHWYVHECEKKQRQGVIVWDPVGKASGDKNLNDQKIEIPRMNYPQYLLLTPNYHEACRLTNHSPQAQLSVHERKEEINELAQHFFQWGFHHVLIKGGHMDDEHYCHDFHISKVTGTKIFSHPRLAQVHSHGTGCYLSSLILCKEILYPPSDHFFCQSIALAKSQLFQGLRKIKELPPVHHGLICRDSLDRIDIGPSCRITEHN